MCWENKGRTSDQLCRVMMGACTLYVGSELPNFDVRNVPILQLLCRRTAESVLELQTLWEKADA